MKIKRDFLKSETASSLLSSTRYNRAGAEKFIPRQILPVRLQIFQMYLQIILQEKKMYRLIKIQVAVFWKFQNLNPKIVIIFFLSLMLLQPKEKFKAFYNTKPTAKRWVIYYLLQSYKLCQRGFCYVSSYFPCVTFNILQSLFCISI